MTACYRKIGQDNRMLLSEIEEREEGNEKAEVSSEG